MADEINFEVPVQQRKALEDLAGGRKVRLSGQIRGGKLVIDNVSFAKPGEHFPVADHSFVAVNAPFKIGAVA
jgi:hypothetical protein